MATFSERLRELGFRMVLGTTEYNAEGKPSTKKVGLGTPNTWGHRNNVAVIYDEEGRPWLDCELAFGVHALADFFMLNGADAYVPHSDDGGYFAREMWPKLRKS